MQRHSINTNVDRLRERLKICQIDSQSGKVGEFDDDFLREEVNLKLLDELLHTCFLKTEIRHH